MRSFLEKYGPWGLITGASSGIGAEFARQLAKQGLNLVLVARRKERLDQLGRQLEAQQRIRTKAVPADLSNPDFLSVILPATDGLEIGLLVNSAGFALSGAFLDNDLDSELAMLDVNCRAGVILAHEFGRRMKERGHGGIIFISSVMAHLSSPYWAGYAASKAHNLLYGEALRFELKKHGIDVLALCPGATRTEFQEVAGITDDFPMMSVEPVVALALRKLGKRPSVLAGWQNRSLYGLIKLLPRRTVTAVWGRIVRRILKDRLADVR